ncbi:MAG TPA: SDR family NAD(P)-dependent oxidoreductase [Turneriella sp.]|nr:SDR family NAD(P)-dependent oxidoreductase [Turneriella sp.]
MNLAGKTIAVTGASGMIGVYICRALLRRGAKVVGVVRNPEKAAFLANEGVEFRRADLADRAALEAAFAGCDAVVSNAALYRLTALDWESNYRPNKEGTENVYRAAAKNGIRRAVQISTIGLYQFSLFSEIDENSPQVNGEAREGGAYRATKQLSESLAWHLCNANGIALTALRPSGVYGARDTNIMPYFAKLMKLPFLPFPGFAWPLVYAGDVADAVVAALENDQSAGEAYNTTGDTSDFADFLEAWQRVSGRGRVFKITPSFGLRVSHAKASRDLGFRNRPFDEALAEIFAEEPELLR